MNLRSIAVLACRILAIVALMILLQSSASFIPLFGAAFSNNEYIPEPKLSIASLLFYLSPMFLLLMFAIVLWMRADSIAVHMVPNDNATKVDLPTDTPAQSLAFSILGAYVLTSALPQIARMSVSAWKINSLPSDAYRNWIGLGAVDFVFPVVQIALGLYLLFGARGLITLLANARNLGRDNKLNRQETDDDTIPVRPEK